MFRFMNTFGENIYIESGGIYSVHEPTVFDCPTIVGYMIYQVVVMEASFENSMALIERYNDWVDEDGHKLFDVSGKQDIISMYRKDKLRNQWIEK